MATKFSQIPINTIFKAGGSSYRKVDALYYEDLVSGFQSTWDPMFDKSIVSSAVKEETPSSEVNTTDKFIVDPSSRVMKLNPDYQEASSEAEKWFGEMWGSAEFDCGPEDYEWMATTSVAAIKSMKQLALLVGLDGRTLHWPVVIDTLSKAYVKYEATKGNATRAKKARRT